MHQRSSGRRSRRPRRPRLNPAWSTFRHRALGPPTVDRPAQRRPCRRGLQARPRRSTSGWYWPGLGPRARRKRLNPKAKAVGAAPGARSARQHSRRTLSGARSQGWSALNAPSARRLDARCASLMRRVRRMRDATMPTCTQLRYLPPGSTSLIFDHCRAHK
jgi:hypothetical protein